ncbi:alanine racemase C-terminal domain-containing protein [Microbacterium sp. CH12i]|uniref:alanine racemase C-terminal domain-containing protein n=1 Tax=Microbacterium sp. CH12i TaxID=1479651 RepID=UPI000565CEAA|nr:alanine racemase C-terminal domain-containing protein [Microbacterium sp. CH12i]
MRASVAAAVADGGRVADLRGDAFGHGAIQTARILAEAGVAAVVVDDHDVARRLTDIDIVTVLDEAPDIDSELLYGLPPASAVSPMRLMGRVLSTKPVRAGEAVSYGHTHRFDAPTTVALVTGGYAQGIVRALGNHAHVELGGALHPIVGRVAMDVCVVDLQTTDAETTARLEGADVVYFGGSGAIGTSLAQWAAVTGMSAAELITVAGAKAVREWTK